MTRSQVGVVFPVSLFHSSTEGLGMPWQSFSFADPALEREVVSSTNHCCALLPEGVGLWKGQLGLLS